MKHQIQLGNYCAWRDDDCQIIPLGTTGMGDGRLGLIVCEFGCRQQHIGSPIDQSARSCGHKITSSRRAIEERRFKNCAAKTTLESGLIFYTERLDSSVNKFIDQIN